MIEFNSGYYIEHVDKAGWFLYDFGHSNDILHLIWSPILEICKYWDTEEEVHKMLEYSIELESRAHIINLTKEKGYHAYFKNK